MLPGGLTSPAPVAPLWCRMLGSTSHLLRGERRAENTAFWDSRVGSSWRREPEEAMAPSSNDGTYNPAPPVGSRTQNAFFDLNYSEPEHEASHS